MKVEMTRPFLRTIMIGLAMTLILGASFASATVAKTSVQKSTQADAAKATVALPASQTSDQGSDAASVKTPSVANTTHKLVHSASQERASVSYGDTTCPGTEPCDDK
jgi:methionine-rich copper-binding protein CopC